MSLRVVMAVTVAGGLAVTAAGLSPLASAAPVATAPVSAAPALVISGVVRAADTRRPLARVKMAVLSTVDQNDIHYPATDAAGRYRVTGLRPGAEYTVTFLPGPGSRYQWQAAPGVTSPYRARAYRAPAVVDVSLSPGVTVSGRVTTSTGAAASGAEVAVVPVESTDDVVRVRTDSRGRWSAVVRPGGVRVMSFRTDGASAGFYPGGRSPARTAVLTVGSRGHTGVDMRQPAPSRLRVTVTAAATGRPVTDACVTPRYPAPATAAQRPGTEVGVPLLSSRTHRKCAGAGGVYTVGVEPGTVAVEVTGAGEFGRAATAPVRVAAGATVRTSVRLTASGILQGRIVDRDTGEPVEAGVRMEPLVPVGGSIGSSSGPDGVWGVSGLAAGRYRVRVIPGATYAGGYAPAADTADDAGIYLVRPGVVTEVPPIRVARVGRITGRVLDGRGRPVAGAGVFVEGGVRWTTRHPSTTTDAAGRYTLTELAPRAQRVRVVPPSHTGLGSSWLGAAGDPASTRTVTVPVGGSLSVPDLRLSAGARLAVVLGAVDASVVVEALDVHGRVVGHAPARLPLSTGTAGRTVTLTGLPATAVRVHAFSTRTDPIRHGWLGGRDFTTAEPVALTAGRTVTVSMQAPTPATTAATTRPATVSPGVGEAA